MARQLRITFPGACHHIYSRGNQKQAIFQSDEDRNYFLKVLGDACWEFGMVIYAYCLMPNHYHLFAASFSGELSRALHWINTTYTVYYNKKHDRTGHLFQGRFKSILVETETYGWELSRYIHLNPVRAGLVRHPEDYFWASYQDYIGMRRPRAWLDTSLIFGPSADPSAEERGRYSRFVMAGIGAAPPDGYEEARRSGVMGSAQFKDRVGAEILGERVLRPDRERPQLRYHRKRVPPAEIVDLVNSMIGARNKFAKGLAILACQRAAGHPLNEIGEFFGLSISGTANRRRRILEEMKKDPPLASIFQEIIERLNRDPAVQGPTILSESDDG